MSGAAGRTMKCPRCEHENRSAAKFCEECATQFALAEELGMRPLAAHCHDLPWIETRPGVRQQRIWEDTVTERRALLARFEPGATLPPHRHVGDGRSFSSWARTRTNRVSWRPAT